MPSCYHLLACKFVGQQMNSRPFTSFPTWKEMTGRESPSSSPFPVDAGNIGWAIVWRWRRIHLQTQHVHLSWLMVDMLLIPGRFMMNRLSAAADTGIHMHAYDYRTTFSYSRDGPDSSCCLFLFCSRPVTTTAYISISWPTGQERKRCKLWCASRKGASIPTAFRV